jgi:hypothetical protein
MNTKSEDDTDVEMPECKAVVAVEPTSMVRFEMSMERAGRIHDAMQAEYESDAQPNNIALTVKMDDTTFSSLTNNFQHLVSNTPMVGVAQIPLSPDPEIAITVLLDKPELQSSVRTNQTKLQDAGEQNNYTQKFWMGRNSVILFLKQLEAAFNGATDPVNAIDIDKIRRSVR